MSDDIIIDDGEPVDTGDASTSDPVDQEPVVDPGDDGNRPIIDWDEDPIEGDANAQQTFTSQPVPPYRPGDLWQDTDWYICVNGKSEGQSFALTDWEPFEAVEPTPTTSTRTVTYVESITDYSAAKLAEYEARGAVAYAVYDDGTRQQVAWSAVSEPQTAAPSVIADEALIIAQVTNQHFWHRSTDPDSDGAGTGAFVTDEEQDDFLSAIASGTAPTTARPLHNLLMNAEGILIRAATRIRAAFTPSGVAFYDGQGNSSGNVNAAFGSDGFQIGRSGESHLTGDYHSLQLIDKDNSAYFHVSDLRGTDGTATVSMTPSIVTATALTLPIPATEVVSVTENGTTVDPSLYTLSSSTSVRANGTTWDTDASYIVEFVTESDEAKAFTFGNRLSGSVTGAMSYVEGVDVTASGYISHAEGVNTTASGVMSHAEGVNTTASGVMSHADGENTTASGHASHAEGYYTTASGYYSHAEGRSTTASGGFSHAEGSGTTARGYFSHAEGNITAASGGFSHAEGDNTAASGQYSHAQNRGTIAASNDQTALGRWNVADSQGDYAAIIGNGTSDSARSNALTVDWSGNVEVAGSVKPGNTTAGRAVITGANGEVTTSSVTSTELYRLSGITSNVQNQIDALQSALDALDTWTDVALTDFATIASGWSFVTSGCNVQFNAALGAVRVRLQVQTAAAQTAGSKTLFTVKSAYRPKTFPAAVPSITANAQTAQIWTTGGFSPVVAAIGAGTSLQFNGVYFIGS